MASKAGTSKATKGKGTSKSASNAKKKKVSDEALARVSGGYDQETKLWYEQSRARPSKTR